MEICYGKKVVNDFSGIVNKTSASDLSKLTCSTIPLLCYWKNYQGRIRHLLEKIGAEFTEPCTLHFEYPVKSANYRSKASYSDVMFRSKPVSVGIEGKWQESKYQTVEEWLKEGNKGNRKVVIEHWKRLIAPRSRGIGNIDKVVYQMLHRTASACAQKSDKAVVLYQVFSDSTPKDVDYCEHLRDLVEAISPKANLEIWLQYVEISKTDHYHKTENALSGIKDPKHRASIVRNAILGEDLYQFEPEDPKKISA